MNFTSVKIFIKTGQLVFPSLFSVLGPKLHFSLSGGDESPILNTSLTWD